MALRTFAGSCSDAPAGPLAVNPPGDVTSLQVHKHQPAPSTRVSMSIKQFLASATKRKNSSSNDGCL